MLGVLCYGECYSYSSESKALYATFIFILKLNKNKVWKESQAMYHTDCGTKLLHFWSSDKIIRFNWKTGHNF